MPPENNEFLLGAVDFNDLDCRPAFNLRCSTAVRRCFTTAEFISVSSGKVTAGEGWRDRVLKRRFGLRTRGSDLVLGVNVGRGDGDGVGEGDGGVSINEMAGLAGTRWSFGGSGDDKMLLWTIKS